MRLRWGLGPVFAYESMVRSRRWQGYAARAGFVLLVLTSLAFVRASMGTTSGLSPAQLLAMAGLQFLQALTVTQLALVMLAAPAATAGAICLDRARGSLAHLLTTDLSDCEIVLGKLAARLVPVLRLLGCALPVVALGTLLGGIDPWTLSWAFVVSAGLAVLGCSLALCLSNWLAKTHEVLTVVYALWAAWLLAWPICEAMIPGSHFWLQVSHPFYVMLAPYSIPGVTWREPACFTLGCLVVSTVLILTSVRELRPAYRRQVGRSPKETGKGRIALSFPRKFPRWPGPSLDKNPVLWREWHRSRPSRVVRVVWWLYIGISSFFSLLVIHEAVWTGRNWGLESASLLNAIQVTIGLLLLSVSAATALAEERVRGGLDILLTTPLSTRAIVRGKWWGAYRWVPVLAVWPCLVNLALASDKGTTSQTAWVVLLVPALILMHGAAVTSLGLALATWTPRLGRAVAGTVAALVLMTVGWPLVGFMNSSNRPDEGVTALLVQGSPFYSVGILTSLLEHHRQGSRFQIDAVAGGFLWLVIYVLIAGGLLRLTLITFDGLIGRVPEIPRARRIGPDVVVQGAGAARDGED